MKTSIQIAEDIFRVKAMFHDDEAVRQGIISKIAIAIEEYAGEAVRQTDDKWRAKETDCIDGLRAGLKICLSWSSLLFEMRKGEATKELQIEESVMSPFTDEHLKRLKEDIKTEKEFEFHVSTERLEALLARLEKAEDVIRCAVAWHGEILTFKEEYKEWCKSKGDAGK
jgi:hypothetical protein